MNNMNGKYIVTADGWFFAPDGKQYKAVWGEVTVLEDSFLGVKTNRNSSNWFIKIGSENNHVIIAGCQIHYCVKSDIKPKGGLIDDYHTDHSVGIKNFQRPSQIYIAE